MLIMSVRKDGETDKDFLHRTQRSLDFDDSIHRPNFKEYANLQRYFAASSERSRY